MMVVFCAFGAELGPLRARLRRPERLGRPGLRGYRGRLGEQEVALVVSGIGIRRAQATAGLALDNLEDVSGVMIAGVAGALHEELGIGDVVVGDRLMLRREDSFTTEHQLEVSPVHLTAALSGLQSQRIKHTRGAIITSRRVVATAAEKRRIRATLGAIAVDMESAVIAQQAASRALPFTVVRAIMDTAAQDLEGALLTDADGRIRLAAAVRLIVRKPRLVAASLRLLRDLRIAAENAAIAIEAILTNGPVGA
ncbi:MAG TPA: 5'-methylthioadenosine/S-adenosylhomocysteine nucleosidase [Candidatus Binataceae bacterium]|jgi:adenosylhomocysteine nucleosidase|nr:5'-methylthioadenosine/S-adenosylhomocysteine nucleosidase [Candidatus Binataceae bacterium]